MILTANCSPLLKGSKHSALFAKQTKIKGGERESDEKADAVNPYFWLSLPIVVTIVTPLGKQPMACLNSSLLI